MERCGLVISVNFVGVGLGWSGVVWLSIRIFSESKVGNAWGEGVSCRKY